MNRRLEWQQETTIRSYESGPDGKAGPAVLCNLLQECAGSHADHLGIGIECMRERGFMWALARLGIEIFRRPEVNERVVVRTWLGGVRGPFAMREFILLDSGSSVIANASYAWLAISQETKRSVRPTRLLGDLAATPEKESFHPDLGKIPKPIEPRMLEPVLTPESDIDLQRHVNNTRLVAWIEDAAKAVKTACYVSKLQVNFLEEAFAGERLDVRIGAPPDGREGDIVVLTRGKDGKEIVRAFVTLKGQEEIAPVAAGEETGEQISDYTLAAAAKIAGISLTPQERAQALGTVSEFPDAYKQRRKVDLKNDIAPALVFQPGGIVTGGPRIGTSGKHQPSQVDDRVARLPADESDIVYAPLRRLSAWIKSGQLTSTRLCELYLERLKKHGDTLSCVVTLTEEIAYRQAARADEEINRGELRGTLHGIPWGAKDLLDTKGIPTTWGATPYKSRVPDRDAAVVGLLEKAGAVLLGKLSLGALAYGDIWFGGKTKNPWNIKQGSSGSSAGSAAAVTAGLAGFCIGSETMGSIVSPSLRCGAAGLKPSFGRVPRTGAMALSWSFDKIGPICRYVEDTALVLEAISAFDAGDTGSRDLPFSFDYGNRLNRVGYSPEWFAKDEQGIDYSDTLESIRGAFADAGIELVEIELPDLPYRALFTLISVDAAAAFEELTLSDGDDELVWQDREAWPNTFRSARFFPAVEYVQLQRLRRLVMDKMEPLFKSVDAMISPEGRSTLLAITNNTGQPSLTIRAGFREDGTPFGVNLWGRYLGEGEICRIGMVLETAFAVADRRPPGFE